MSTVLRMSSLFVRTLRDDPADAEVPSHRLLVRAGYIRRNAPGIYTWLPLGLRVLRKIENIVRDEMDAIGAQELLFPALLPREPYDATGRWTEYGDGIFRLKDRKGADYLLGPTHEEMFTLVVKDLYSSYKDLPLAIYQIQNKYRDEARPRAGLLRGREFVMKDAYTFDIDDAGLDRRLRAFPGRLHPDLRQARLRVRHRARHAGAMGGSKSEEFLAKAEVGEDTYVQCSSATTRPTSRPSRWPRRHPSRTTTPRRRTQRRRPTPRRSSRWSTMLNETFPRDDRAWVASDTLKSVLMVLTLPRRHDRGRSRSAYPVIARSTRSGSRRRSYPAEFQPVRRRGLRTSPRAGQGLHGPRRAG